MCRKLTQNLKLAPEVDLEAIARSTEGLTGADLKALLYTAQLGRVPQRNSIMHVYYLGQHQRVFDVEDQALSPSYDSSSSLSHE